VVEENKSEGEVDKEDKGQQRWEHIFLRPRRRDRQVDRSTIARRSTSSSSAASHLTPSNTPFLPNHNTQTQTDRLHGTNSSGSSRSSSSSTGHQATMSETKARKQDKQEEEEEEAFIQFHDSDDGTCVRRDGQRGVGGEEGAGEGGGGVVLAPFVHARKPHPSLLLPLYPYPTQNR